MKKELLNINVRTVPNGYVLDLENKSYMYYNLSELLDGFIYHVGLEELDEIDAEARLDIITAAMTWKENGKAIKELIKQKKANERLENTNKRLQNSVKNLKMKLGKVANDDDDDDE